MKYKGRTMYPIHVVMWRLPWFIIAWVCRLIGTGVVFIGWGKSVAKDYWGNYL